MTTTEILKDEHLEGARLFADRRSALRALPRGGTIAEIGVAVGDFTEALIDTLDPDHFDAFDIFDLHQGDMVGGRSTQEVFDGLTHRQFYEKRFAPPMDVFEGDSSTQLAQMPDQHYDVIYLDGDHRYEGILRDADVASNKIKPGGVLVFNDYIMFDHHLGERYGASRQPVLRETWLEGPIFCARPANVLRYRSAPSPCPCFSG